MSMELCHFRHQSDSRYCFSLDETHVLIRLAVAKCCHLDEVEVVYGDPMTFGGEHKSLRMEKRHQDLGFDYYEAVLQAKLTRFMYIFHIRSGSEQYYYSESRLTQGYEFSIAFITAFQFVGENPNDFVLEKPSWQGSVFYQIFPERFASRENPKNKEYVTLHWNAPTMKGKHDVMLGGDLYGILDKLDYLEDLGVDVLYLTPIHPSKTNHKYDVLDYFDVDPYFGGKKAFRELVDSAHARGMKIVMDLVFNHTSDKHPFFLDIKENGKQSKYYYWYFIEDDFPQAKPLNYRCFGYHPYMPKLNTNNPEVQEYLVSVGEYWSREFGVDGYRLDVSEGVSHDFWTKFKIALKKINPEVILIGENWLNAESYLGPNQFDGVMNYPFLNVISAYALRVEDAKMTANALDGLLMRYKDGHNRMMLNLLSSHDVQRTRTLCKGDADLSLFCHAIMMFFLGYPMIYYGEEVFMEGGRDPDNRRGMVWGSKEFSSERHKIFKQLIHLRHEDPLAKGDIEVYEINGLLAIKRTFAGISYVLYANQKSDGQSVEGNIVLGYRHAGGNVYPEGFVVVKQ